MKKILVLLSLMLLIGSGAAADEPIFTYFSGEICDGGTDYKIVPIENNFNKGLMIRLYIFSTPPDSVLDTTKVMLQTRFATPGLAGKQDRDEGFQPWEVFTDSFVTADDDTSTTVLWFPIDSLVAGYDGTYLGDQLRFEFTTTDSVTYAWCDSHTTSLQYQITLGYF